MFTPANGDRDTVPNYAIIVTDGNSNINQQNTIKEAIEARVDGVHIITVSVGMSSSCNITKPFKAYSKLSHIH